MIGTNVDRIYKLGINARFAKRNKSAAFLSETNISLEIWHRRFGHLNNRNLKNGLAESI